MTINEAKARIVKALKLDFDPPAFESNSYFVFNIDKTGKMPEPLRCITKDGKKFGIFHPMLMPLEEVQSLHEVKLSHSAQNELTHYGIPGKSGRYPLGSGNRPYQADRFAKSGKRKQKGPGLIAQAKAKAAQAKENAAAKRRQQILQDPKKLYKHRNEFTREEVENAIREFEWQDRVQDFSARRVRRGKEVANDFLSMTNIGINFYNNAARVFNSFGDPDSRIPYIEPAIVTPDNKKKK